MSFITTYPEDDYQSKSMKRLQDAIFRVAGSKISHPLSLETTLRINVLLGEISSMNHDLDHPPYSEMICKAIEELHEEGGSNEPSISSYIKSQFHDLPWAHESLLSHHLGQLSSKGQIISSLNGFYKLPLSNPKPNSKKNKQLPQKENDKSLVLHDEDDHGGVKNFPMKAQEPPTKLSKQCGRPLKPKPGEKMGSGEDQKQKQGGNQMMMKEVKKRRGRTSKKVKEDTVLMEKKAIYGPKRRRGRPSKPKLEEALVCDGVKEDTVLMEKKVIYGPKKRRGRPPRPKLEAALVCAGLRNPAAACSTAGALRPSWLWPGRSIVEHVQESILFIQ